MQMPARVHRARHGAAATPAPATRQPGRLSRRYRVTPGHRRLFYLMSSLGVGMTRPGLLLGR